MGIQEDMNRINEPLYQLTEALKQSPQYQEFIRCERALEDDAGARQLLDQFSSLHASSDLDRQKAERAQKLREVIQENQVIQDYIAARKQLAELCQQVESTINQTLQFDFGDACAPRGGCC